MAENQPPQAQQGAQDKKRKADEKDSDEIQFFDTMIVKLVPKKDDEGKEVKDDNGDTEWVEVLSDNLYPGERLKREVDEEKAEEKAEAERKEREKADKDAANKK